MKNKRNFGKSPFTGNVVSLHTYLRHWRSLYKPIAKEYNLHIIGYDPNIQFKEVSIPVSLAIKMCNILKEKNKKVKE